jgi:hypothetical protein
VARINPVSDELAGGIRSREYHASPLPGSIVMRLLGVDLRSLACRAPGTLFPVPPGRLGIRKREFPTSTLKLGSSPGPFTRKFPGQIGNRGERESGASGSWRHSPPGGLCQHQHVTSMLRTYVP